MKFGTVNTDLVQKIIKIVKIEIAKVDQKPYYYYLL
jgi:hypothetical protein